MHSYHRNKITWVFCDKGDLQDFCWTNAWRQPEFMMPYWVLLNSSDISVQFRKAKKWGHCKMRFLHCPHVILDQSPFVVYLVCYGSRRCAFFTTAHSRLQFVEHGNIGIALSIREAPKLLIEMLQWKNGHNGLACNLLPQGVGPVFLSDECLSQALWWHVAKPHFNKYKFRKRKHNSNYLFCTALLFEHPYWIFMQRENYSATEFRTRIRILI